MLTFLCFLKIDKGHCKIAYESDEDAMDVVDFYDFSSSYPQGYDPENPDIDSELAQLTNDIQLGEDEMELILPSGARIGHRSLQRYYKQSFKPDDVSANLILRGNHTICFTHTYVLLFSSLATLF